jgi:DNA-binding LacI/PurR family transcriptional regulator
MAITACRRLNEAGFDVPHDVSVTGFDGLIEALYHTPSITTACLDTEKAVHRAFSVFDAFFRGDPVSMTYIIDFKVIFGASSDCRHIQIFDFVAFRAERESVFSKHRQRFERTFGKTFCG